MYIKKIIVTIVLLTLIGGGIFSYYVYTSVLSPNTAFNNKTATVFIPTGAQFSEVQEVLEPLLKDMGSFESVAEKKGYVTNIKAGKYRIENGMNNNQIVNTLRSANIPVRVAFNNQETIENLAGRIAKQIETDSISLLKAFKDEAFLKNNGFNANTMLAMYIPNSYDFFWNISAQGFRDKMLKEYHRFWNEERLQKAKALKMDPTEIISLASIVHKETVKIDERPRVAGVYLNRLRKNILLQADPTVIYALKLRAGDFTKVYKRVLYKDLEIDSPYNTYKYAGVPPGPIAMPDISAIDAVLNAEKHDYYYFVANVENFGYHKFAKTLAQHNQNKVQYIRWVNKQKINR
ncbi:endolytic transglycosylase MltG [Spongiimicrobium salis]|uniref:endolytic transglycosylase MltG n=1 Tax=Spongiimicrobium salis TaxID=1667022 RepID=UPI00374DC167